MTPSPKYQRVRRLGATAALAAGLFAGGISVASAATHTHSSAAVTTSAQHPHQGGRGPGGPGGPAGPGAAGGVVTAVSSSSITVTTPQSTSATYAITSSTVVEKGHATATLSDVVVGDRVDIRPSAQGSTTAAEIDIDVPHLAGQVVSVSGNVITVSDREGFYRTIDVSSATTYAKSGASSTLSAVTVGSFIGAEGSIASDHTTLDASSVTIGLPTPPAGAPTGTPPGM